MLHYTLVIPEGKPLSDVMWKPTTVVTKGVLPTGDAVITTVWHHPQSGLFYNHGHILQWHPRCNLVIYTRVFYIHICTGRFFLLTNKCWLNTLPHTLLALHHTPCVGEI